MKSVIIYSSVHHKNTFQLVEAIAKQCEIDVIDATVTKEKDLSKYDIIGFASGIYYSKFHKTISEFAKKNLPANKKVFFLYTCGSPRSNYLDEIKKVVSEKTPEFLGDYFCRGFDTYGPFKLVGGIAKGHPTVDEVAGAVDFMKKILS